MDMISLLTPRGGRGGSEGEEEKGNPLSRIVVITSMKPGFEKAVLGTANVCTVLVAEKPQLSTCQASREQTVIKGSLFLQGEGGKVGGGKKSDPIGIRCHSVKVTSHPISSYIHSPPQRYAGNTNKCKKKKETF